MFNFWLLTFSDFIVISISLIVWLLFIIFWADKIFKIYFWLVIGFLIFQVFNSELELLEIVYFKELSPFQYNLIDNKELILWILVLFIPLLAFFASMHKNITLKEEPKRLTIIIFWSFLPIVFLWILAFVSVNSYTIIPFLRDFLSIFNDSYIFYYLERNNSLVFFVLIFLTFYKIVFSFLLRVILNISVLIKSKMKWLQNKEIEYEEEYEWDEIK